MDPTKRSTTAILLQIAQFNDNNAVPCLAEANLPIARQSFVKLLRDLRDMCKDGAHHDHQDGGRRYQDVKTISYEETKRSVFPRFMSVTQRLRADTLQHSEMAHFDKAIFLQGSDVRFDVNSTASVLLYNTALLHHTEGLITGCANSFRSAVSFYKQVLSLLSQQQRLLCESSTLLLVTCATLNNLSHCYMMAFAEAGTAQSYACQLEELLARATNLASEYMAPSELEFFYSSLMFTQMFMRSKAAPAA